MTGKEETPAPSEGGASNVRRSITGDLVIGLVLIVALVSIMAISLNHWLLSKKIKNHFDEKSKEYLTYLQDSLTIPLWNYDQDGIGNICSLFLKNELVTGLKVTDSLGQVIFENILEEPEFKMVSGRVLFADQVIGHIEMSLTNRIYKDNNRQLLLLSLITFLIVVVVLILFTTLFVNIFLKKPLSHLMNRIDQIAKGEYESAFPPKPEQREIREIISAFNRMAQKIESRENSLHHVNATLRQEIEERKQAEKSLAESEFRFRLFFNSSPDGIVLADFEGKILNVNKSLVRMTGYDVTEFKNQNIMDFTPSKYHDNILSDIELIKKGIIKDAPFEIECFKKDGSLIPVTARGWTITDEQSNPLILGLFVKDITKEKSLIQEKATLEKQLRHTQKMEAIGTLAGGIAHDFNNILGGIMAYADLSMTRTPAGDEKLKNYTVRILEGANRAKDLIQQILQFSRGDSSAVTLTALKPVVKEAIKLLQATLPSTIEVSAEILANKDLIMGDATQIHQIIMNLCTNAYHAMREKGGKLTVKIENIKLEKTEWFQGSEVHPGEYVKLSVEDTGHGIPPDIQDQIFDPYFTTKKVNEGSGLGLSVTMGIVKSHNGLIRFNSHLNQGTVFNVFLPLMKTGVSKDIASPPPRISAGHGERILIVDDENIFLEAVREYLEISGYRVTDSQSSMKALEIFRDDPHSFDLLITDQTMPEMTGVQMTSEIRKLNPTIPIILCTGFSDIVSEETAGNCGVTHFLMKPVSGKNLAAIVAEELKLSARQRQT
jgi:PAS domain S-box-containing protein